MKTVLGICTMVAILSLTTLAVAASGPDAGTDNLPAYLKDRGTGVPTSMFGTYVERGELLVYPFFEYYYDNDFEYSPAEFGFGYDKDYRGKYRASEYLIFLGYAFTDMVALEVEVAAIDASLEKAPADTSDMPPTLSESGLGDVQMQLDWRWMKETEDRPEVFSFGEVVFPFNKDDVLIGTSDWEFKLGVGAIRGYRWGTLTGRAAVEYSAEESKVELGELAIEYLKRVSPAWRLYGGVEASQDEVELILEAQWHVSRYAFIKLNSGFGLTSKATDWAPEIGVVFRVPVNTR